MIKAMGWVANILGLRRRVKLVNVWVSSETQISFSHDLSGFSTLYAR